MVPPMPEPSSAGSAGSTHPSPGVTTNTPESPSTLRSGPGNIMSVARVFDTFGQSAVSPVLARFPRSTIVSIWRDELSGSSLVANGITVMRSPFLSASMKIAVFSSSEGLSLSACPVGTFVKSDTSPNSASINGFGFFFPNDAWLSTTTMLGCEPSGGAYICTTRISAAAGFLLAVATCATAALGASAVSMHASTLIDAPNETRRTPMGSLPLDCWHRDINSQPSGQDPGSRDHSPARR